MKREVTALIAPLMSHPRINATQISQILLGDSVEVLEEKGRGAESWYRCKSWDGYEGYLHAGYVGEPLPESLGSRWVIQSARAVFDGVRLELPFGGRIRRARSEDPVFLRGRWVEIEGELLEESKLTQAYPLQLSSVLRLARQWIGVPYLWGGNSKAGVDCSGFVQAVYRMHSITLARDACLQAVTNCERVEDPKQLVPGSLIFFRSQEGRIYHVALAGSKGTFLHSSVGAGGVQEDEWESDDARVHHLRRELYGQRQVLPASPV